LKKTSRGSARVREVLRLRGADDADDHEGLLLLVGDPVEKPVADRALSRPVAPRDLLVDDAHAQFCVVESSAVTSRPSISGIPRAVKKSPVTPLV
jgi:hypothetical protein